MKKIATLILAALAAMPASAQLHESISVEGAYVPDIIRRDRVSILPAAERFTLDADPLPFERSGVATPFSPSLLTMPASVWHGSRIPARNRGYVSAALGSWLDSDLSAGYRIVDSDRSRLGASLQFNSTSLWKPRNPAADPELRRELYDGTLGLYGSHRFGDAGTLSALASYRLAWFNYYGTTPQPYNSTTPQLHNFPSQTLNAFCVKAGWSNRLPEPDPTAVLYSVGADVRGTYFRALQTYWGSPDSRQYRGQRETLAGVDGSFAMPWGEGEQSVGADARLDLAFYSNAGKTPEELRAENYANFRLTPYYRFNRDRLTIRAGANLEFTSGAGTPEDRFPLFHISPDVRADWATKGVGLFARFAGGNRLSTLASHMAGSPYLSPYLATTRPTYIPLDAEAGVSVGPFAGFSATASVAYRMVRGAELDGWYQYMINSANGAICPEGLSTRGWKLSLDARYEYGRLLAVSAAAAWMPRDAEKGYFDNLDRAKCVVNAKAEVRPVDNLTIAVSYTLRSARRFFRYEEVEPVDNPTVVVGSSSDYQLSSLRAPNVSTLGIRAEWRFSPAFSVFALADNLLCRKEVMLPGLTTARLTAAAGFDLKF